MKRFLAILMTLCMVIGSSCISVWAAEEATWQVETPMPTARQESISCAVGNKIYVMGGETGTSDLDTVEIYDTITHKWSEGPKMPEKRSGFTASVVGDKIYALGGRTLGSNTGSVLIYDTKNNIWKEGKSMTAARTFLTSAVVGNKIYAIGGCINFKNTGVVEIYDIESDTWSTGKPMPTARSILGSAVDGNKIYAIGGHDSLRTLDIVEIYDTETGTWSTGNPTKARCSHTCEKVGDNIYLIGGSGSSGTLATIEIYSILKNTWIEGPALIRARYNHSSAVVNGTIYVMGGTVPNGILTNSMESLKVAEPEVNKSLLSVLLNVDETAQLSVAYNLTDNTALTWTSSDAAVATVDQNGKVKAVGEGLANIYAQNTDGTFKEYIPVKVVPGGADAMRLAVHLKVGEKAKFHLSDDSTQVTWKSMDETVATVSATGQVTAAKKGLAIIQGELGGQPYQIYVRVNG